MLLVCDEVKVGLARSGTLHAFQADDVAPDIVCLGKGLGGGLPLSAVIGPAEVMDHAPAFSLMTTAGNPVCASAGLAVLDVIERDGLMARAAAAGERLQAGLRALGSPLVADVRGRGLAVGRRAGLGRVRRRRSAPRGRAGRGLLLVGQRRRSS